MIKFSMIATGAALAALTLASPAAAGVNDRQQNQKSRIVQGVKSGALTGRETGRLVRQQGKIARYEARSRADGPGLTPKERVRINRMQDRASANIFRQKHDRQRRNR